MALTKREQGALDNALALLHALIEVDNERCSLPTEIKEAVRPYIRSWVIPGIEFVATPTNKREFGLWDGYTDQYNVRRR